MGNCGQITSLPAVRHALDGTWWARYGFRKGKPANSSATSSEALTAGQAAERAVAKGAGARGTNGHAREPGGGKGLRHGAVSHVHLLGQAAQATRPIGVLEEVLPKPDEEHIGLHIYINRSALFFYFGAGQSYKKVGRHPKRRILPPATNGRNAPVELGQQSVPIRNRSPGQRMMPRQSPRQSKLLI